MMSGMPVTVKVSSLMGVFCIMGFSNSMQLNTVISCYLLINRDALLTLLLLARREGLCSCHLISLIEWSKLSWITHQKQSKKQPQYGNLFG